MYHFFFQVIDLPDERPIITGANDRGYRVGDWLDVNCTSPKSNPPSLLKWYINDELPTESYNIPIAPQKLSGDLFTARQRLRLQLKRQHFVHGDVTLKCTARIYKEYYMSTSKSYQGLGLSEKALEISGRANGKLTYMKHITNMYMLTFALQLTINIIALKAKSEAILPNSTRY